MGDTADARLMALKIVRMTDGDAARSPLRAWRAGDREVALAALEAPNGAALADEASRLIDLALDDDPTLARRIGAALAAWDDDVAAYRELKRVVEGLVDRSAGIPPIRWAPHAATIACLSEPYLRARPHEPTLLGYAGLALLGLNRSKLAVRLFEAAHALDPAVHGLAASLQMARERAARPISQPLPPDLRARVAIAEAGLDDVARRAGNLPQPGRISFCMIVRDEEEMLPDCLRSIEHVVDELIVVDTGSTDRTVEIAESFGAKVLHFPWIADFSAARNHGIDAATGDFIFWLDADERFEQQDSDQIRELTRQSWREGWWLVETNFTGQDETGTAATHMALRLFRNRKAHRFTGAIHEQITSQMPHDLGERFAMTELRIRHYGYLKSRIDARDKHDRNLSLLREQLTRSPDDPFVHFNTGTEYMGLQEWARASEHLERGFALLQHESGWEGRAYASLLVARLVGVRRSNGDFAGADELAAAMLQRFPGFTDLVFERALLARERGDTDTARTLWQTCLQMGDAPARYAGTVGQGGFRSLQALSELARDAGDRDGARSLLERSLREHPTYLPAVFALANLLLEAPDADPEAVLAALSGYGHEELTWWLFLGTAFYEHNHATIGEDMFRRALAIAPNHPASRVGLGEALLTQHRYADVEAEQGELPEGTLPYIAMQRARVLAGALADDDDAVADAISRLETGGAAPRDTRFMTAFAAAIGGREVGRDLLGAGAAAVQMLDALARLEEFVAFERAAPLLTVAIGDELESSLVLGELFLRRGYYPLAAETAMETINRFGESARALALLGKAAVAEGLYDDALPVLEQAQRLEPGDSSVAYLVDELRARPAA